MLEYHFNEVLGLQPATSLKEWLQHRSFTVNISKLSRTAIFKNATKRFWRMILYGQLSFAQIPRFSKMAFTYTPVTNNFKIFNNFFGGFFPFGYCKTILSMSVTETFTCFCEIYCQPHGYF